MTSIRPARAYADALFDLAAREKGLAEAIAPPLTEIARMLKTNADWQRLWRDPLFAPARGELGETLFARMQLPPLLERFLLLAATREGVMPGLPEIAAHFAARLERARGHIAVDVEIAAPPSAAGKEKLIALAKDFFGAGAKLAWREEPSLLAGFILRAPGRMLDVSLAGQLRRLARHLTRPVAAAPD